MTIHRFLLLLPLLLLGCSTTPEALRGAPENSPTLGAVRSDPGTYRDMALSWGGTIVAIDNLPQQTRLEVVARRLDSSGEPLNKDQSAGRFIAQFGTFLDPAIYNSGRNITVVGRFVEIEERALGQMNYRYPVVEVSAHHLWPEAEPCPECHDPFLYDPLFYDPWYPFGYPYPYHHPWPHY